MSNIKYVGETALNALVEKIKSITGTVTGVMRFVGSLKELPKDNTSYNKGDVILVGTKEYVLNETDGNKVWVEIGDEGLWLNKYDIITDLNIVDEKTTHVTLATIANKDISLKFDFSNLVTKDILNTAINVITSNVQSLLKNMVTNDKLDTYIKKEDVILHNNSDEIFLPKNNNKIISKNILTIGDKSVVVTIDFNDIYNNIDSISKDMTNMININEFETRINEIKSIISKQGHFVSSSNTTQDGHIQLLLKGSTPIAHIKNTNQDIVLDIEKFVKDLRAHLIDTGFVHDDSNTKTTFEEITYEEVENLFK